MKKKTALLTACMVLTFTLAGCGAAKEEAVAEPAEVTEEQTATVTEPEKTVEEPAAVEEKEEEKVEEKTPELVKLFNIGDTDYEAFYYCVDGVFIVKKDGKYGAVDIDLKELVPCKYDGYTAPSLNGYFVLRYTDGPQDLYSPKGELIYSLSYADVGLGTSGNWYLIDDYSTVKYYDFSGNLLVETSMQDEVDTAAVAAYDGVTLLRRYSYVDGKGLVEVGKLKEDGSVTWQTEYDGSVSSTDDSSSDPNVNAGSAAQYCPDTLFGGLIDGYYITYNPWIEWGNMTLYDSDSKEVSRFNVCYYNSEGVYDENNRLEENRISGYFHDGGNQFYRGTKLVIISDGKYMLFDAKEKKILAIYDDISLSPEDVWLVKKGDDWGYIDPEGNELAMFDDAADFYNGNSLVIKDGEIFIVDTDMNTYETGIKATSVRKSGEVYEAFNGDPNEVPADIFKIVLPDAQ